MLILNPIRFQSARCILFLGWELYQSGVLRELYFSADTDETRMRGLGLDAMPLPGSFFSRHLYGSRRPETSLWRPTDNPHASGGEVLLLQFANDCATEQDIEKPHEKNDCEA